MFYLARAVQNVLVLVVETKHAGAFLLQCFEDVKMAVSCGKVERGAVLREFSFVYVFGSVTITITITPGYPWHQHFQTIPNRLISIPPGGG